MMSYENLAINMIPGKTPREKFENMRRIAMILNDLAYPKRGSFEESAQISHFSKLAEEIIPEGPIDIEYYKK
jgi:hypothetical protein